MFQHRERRLDPGELLIIELLEPLGEQSRPPRAPFLQDPSRFGGGFEPYGTPVALVGLAPDQSFRLELLHDAGHAGRLHALGRGELAERSRAAEHEDGQGRALRGPQAHRGVHLPDRSEQVDGGRMEAFGGVLTRGS